jgi:hypothetical protein
LFLDQDIFWRKLDDATRAPLSFFEVVFAAQHIVLLETAYGDGIRDVVLAATIITYTRCPSYTTNIAPVPVVHKSVDNGHNESSSGY